MLWAATNGQVRVGTTTMDYVAFGKGQETLVMLPGLGDGLTTVKGMAVLMAWTYRQYGSRYRVYVFSRKKEIDEGYSTREMAKDQAEAMQALGIKSAYVMGISQGGMIAQYLAIDHPDLVDKLVLAVTLSKQNEMMQSAVSHWIAMAERGAYRALLLDTMDRSYSDAYRRKYRWLYPFLGRMGKPRSFNRFLVQAQSCLMHNAHAQLHKIACPVLVLGGACDRIVGAEASVALADAIQRSELILYNGLGHAAYEESKAFHRDVIRFLGAR
jgi:pimeloyl-ACP methyl ester carboxylesterase